jgi:hypothetical protein
MNSIYASVRNGAIKVATHYYNTKDEWSASSPSWLLTFALACSSPMDGETSFSIGAA